MVERREDISGLVIPMVPSELESSPPSEPAPADDCERVRGVLRKLLTSQATNEEVLETIRQSMLRSNG